MPIYFADPSIDPVSLQSVPEQFLIFYSSVVNGEMWCPDCRAVDSLIQETFGPDGPTALIVYTGTRQQWKTPANIFRQEPWNITGVPSVVRVKDGERLVESQVTQERLAELVK
ncbi:hypothetical protein FA15DRAFT_699361 [Coprinopsis marcescibilis]|uniref:Thioredoxin domain-containing protein n=1 Tax=Coprinopsis marcescibilis TaxID=230819 RepID=A0A5C3LDQ8_COPMA|nr:hypothetical protein FA15DRAFT_699361 [Coprinopsis marcescibilis]